MKKRVYVFKHYDWETDEEIEVGRKAFRGNNAALRYADALSEKLACPIDTFIEPDENEEALAAADIAS